MRGHPVTRRGRPGRRGDARSRGDLLPGKLRTIAGAASRCLAVNAPDGRGRVNAHPPEVHPQRAVRACGRVPWRRRCDVVRPGDSRRARRLIASPQKTIVECNTCCMHAVGRLRSYTARVRSRDAPMFGACSRQKAGLYESGTCQPCGGAVGLIRAGPALSWCGALTWASPLGAPHLNAPATEPERGNYVTPVVWMVLGVAAVVFVIFAGWPLYVTYRTRGQGADVAEGQAYLRAKAQAQAQAQAQGQGQGPAGTESAGPARRGDHDGPHV